MPVVIDELEVMVENSAASPQAAEGGPEASAAPAAPTGQAPPRPGGLSPADVCRVIDRRDARAARLFAH